jgi:hypothetical protein
MSCFNITCSSPLAKAAGSSAIAQDPFESKGFRGGECVLLTSRVENKANQCCRYRDGMRFVSSSDLAKGIKV